MKITIIGCGKMGGSLAQGLAKKNQLTLFDRNESRTKALAKALKATYASTPAKAISGADMIILAIKPQDFEKVAKMIAKETTKDQLIVSVLAGVDTETLQGAFKDNPVLRMMPNLAVRHGEGVIGLEESDKLTKKLIKGIEDVLTPLGSLHWIPASKFDALSALTGSGPAFIFVILESIIDAGVAMGFPADQAKTLAIELLNSSLTMVKESEKHPGDLKWEVTSPGGTTIAGIKMMEDCGIRSGLINTFLATYQRSQEL